MDKKLFYIECLYIFIPVCFLILTATVTFLQFSHMATDPLSTLTKYSQVLDAIHGNLQQEPIQDILFIPENQNNKCPSQYFPMIIGQWAGNKLSCYYKPQDHFFEASCEELKAHIGMTMNDTYDWLEILYNPSRDLYIWKGSRFCAKYNKFKYVNFTTKQCEDGYVPYSGGLICIPKEEKPPITSFSLKEDKDSQKFTLDVSRGDPQDTVMLGISTTFNEVKYQIRHTNDTKLYYDDWKFPLENSRYKNVDHLVPYNVTYKSLDKGELLTFFHNNRLGGIIQAIPGYEKYLTGKDIDLFTEYKVMVNIKPECANILSLVEEISANLREVNLSTSSALSLLGFSAILVVFGFVLCMYLYKKREHTGDQFKEQRFIFHGLHFLPYFISILYIVKSLDAPDNKEVANNRIFGNINILRSNNCFVDNVYSEFLNDITVLIDRLVYQFFRLDTLMSRAGYAFIATMLLVRGLRGYYITEIQEFEKEYLRKRNQNEASTVEMSHSNNIREEDMENFGIDRSPLSPYILY